MTDEVAGATSSALRRATLALLPMLLAVVAAMFGALYLAVLLDLGLPYLMALTRSSGSSSATA